jgi:predicted 3-demethylubiquinone-9 3-methyltransferase (glyoxalase superfamily)
VQKISPFLWFDDNAEEAVDFYCSVFKSAKKGKVSRYSEAGSDTHGQPAGRVMTVAFELEGQSFTALNGGPQFKFNESISLVVSCKNQDEIDYYWSKLTAGGGKEVECGWLKDKFGLSWQIMPAGLIDLVADPQKGPKVMGAVMKMKKLDVAALERAAGGR